MITSYEPAARYSPKYGLNKSSGSVVLNPKSNCRSVADNGSIRRLLGAQTSSLRSPAFAVLKEISANSKARFTLSIADCVGRTDCPARPGIVRIRAPSRDRSPTRSASLVSHESPAVDTPQPARPRTTRRNPGAARHPTHAHDQRAYRLCTLPERSRSRSFWMA